MLNQYFSTIPRISIIAPSGKQILFEGGMYLTDRPDEIEFLDKEVSIGHEMIYTKKGQEKISSKDLDPMAQLREKIIAEYEAKKEAQQSPSRDMGNTAKADPTQGIATSNTIKAISKN